MYASQQTAGGYDRDRATIAPAPSISEIPAQIIQRSDNISTAEDLIKQLASRLAGVLPQVPGTNAGTKESSPMSTKLGSEINTLNGRMREITYALSFLANNAQV